MIPPEDLHHLFVGTHGSDLRECYETAHARLKAWVDGSNVEPDQKWHNAIVWAYAALDWLFQHVPEREVTKT